MASPYRSLLLYALSCVVGLVAVSVGLTAVTRYIGHPNAVYSVVVVGMWTGIVYLYRATAHAHHASGERHVPVLTGIVYGVCALGVTEWLTRHPDALQQAEARAGMTDDLVYGFVLLAWVLTLAVLQALQALQALRIGRDVRRG